MQAECFRKLYQSWGKQFDPAILKVMVESRFSVFGNAMVVAERLIL